MPHRNGSRPTHAVTARATGALVVALAAAAVLPSSAFAATWAGGTGNWSDASRWTPQSVPHQVDVVIDADPATASTVELDAPFAGDIRALTVDAGDRLSVSQSNRYLTAHGNVTVNGTLTMSGTNVRLIMAGGGSKTIGGTGQIVMHVQQGGIDGGFNWGTSITIGPDMTIRGGGGVQGAPVLINNGTLLAENGWLSVYGVTNNGVMRALTPSGPATVNLALYSNWDNNGVIDLQPGTGLTLNGAFETDDIGTVNRAAGTIVQLLGRWNNAARTVDLSTTTGTLLLNTGTITGGTITSSGDARLIVFGDQGPNTLDGVTLATSPVFTDSHLQLTVANTLTLENITIDLSDGNNHRTGNRLAGGALAGTGTIVLGTRQAGINGDNEVVSAIGPGLLVRGTGTAYGINQGTIRADIAGAKLQLRHVENDGLVHATNGSTLEVSSSGTRPFVNRGIVRVDAGSVFTVAPEQSLSQQAAGTLRVDGTVYTSTYRLSLTGGTLSGVGTFAATPTAFVPSMRFGGAMSPGATDDGLKSAGTLTVASNLSFAPGSRYQLELDGASADLLKVVGGSTFAGNLELGPETFLDVRPTGNLLFGTPYLIATYAGTLTGEFGYVTPNFEVDYSQPHAIYVTALVPEPAALTPLPLAAVVVAARRRRRSPVTAPSVQS